MAQIDIDMDILIFLVEARPVIWDKTISTYKDRNETKNAWKEIFLELRPDFEELEGTEKNTFGKHVMKKWVNVRDAFHKSIKEQKDTARSGSGTSTLKTYIYNEQLRFLNKVFKDCQTESSLPATATPSEASDEDISPEARENRDPQVNSKVFKKAEPKKRKLDEVELEMIKALHEKPDRHLSFFKGIIPSLSSFNDDEILEFQTTVLQTIQSIKRRKKMFSARQHISETPRLQDLNSGQQSFTARSHQYTKTDPPAPIPRQIFGAVSFSQTSSDDLNSQPTYHALQPASSNINTNELSMRGYYENIDRTLAAVSDTVLSPLSSSQDSLDFSY